MSATRRLHTKLGAAPLPAPAPAPGPPPPPVGYTAFSSLGLITGDLFYVGVGAKVAIDIDTPSLDASSVAGEVLIVAGKTLTTWGVNILGTGTLIATNGALTLTGAYVPLTGSGTNVTNPGMSRGVMVQPGGTLKITGDVPTTLYTTLNAHAAPAATALTLAVAAAWASADPVVIAPTDFIEYGRTEQFTLSGATSGTSATLNAGLASSRWGLLQYPLDTAVAGSGMSLTAGTFTTKKASAGVATSLDQRARVANLKRGFVISCPADSDWTDKGHGVHVMWMASGLTLPLVQLEGVQIRRGGQRGALGRYPFHAHMNSYRSTGAFTADTPLNYVRKCVVWESENRAYTIHGTCGMDVSDNIAYLCKGHSLFMEDGSERRNTIRRNMMFSTRNPSAGSAGAAVSSMSGNGTTVTVNSTAHGLYSGQTITVSGASNSVFNVYRIPVTVTSANQFTYLAAATGAATGASYIKGMDRIKLHDENSSGYWITNMDNKITDNYACDSDGAGAWCSVGPQCFGASALVPIVPNAIATDTLSGFICHSNGGQGLKHADGVIDELGTANYLGGKYLSSLGDLGIFTSSGHTLWKNAAGGYNNFVNVPNYIGWTVADNAGTDFFGSTNPGGLSKDHLFVGYSLNNAHPQPSAQVAPRNGFVPYHGTVHFFDCTAINYPYAVPYYEFSNSRPVAGGLTTGGGDFYDIPGVDLSTSLNTNLRLVNSHIGGMCAGPNIDGVSPASLHFSIASVWKDGNGYWGTAGKYQMVIWPATGLVDDFLLSGATNVADGPTTGTVVCKTTDTRFFGIGCTDAGGWDLTWTGTPTYGNLVGGNSTGAYLPLLVTRQNIASGAQIGSQWAVKRGDTDPLLASFRTAALQNGGRFRIEYKDGTYSTTPPNLKHTFDIFNANSGTSDFVLLGLDWANGTTARVCYGHGFTGESNTFANSADVTANRARICSAASGVDAAAKIAAVMADTSGSLFFQDTTNNVVWLRYTGGLSANVISPGSAPIDKQTIVIKA